MSGGCHLVVAIHTKEKRYHHPSVCRITHQMRTLSVTILLYCTTVSAALYFGGVPHRARTAGKDGQSKRTGDLHSAQVPSRSGVRQPEVQFRLYALQIAESCEGTRRVLADVYCPQPEETGHVRQFVASGANSRPQSCTNSSFMVATTLPVSPGRTESRF